MREGGTKWRARPVTAAYGRPAPYRPNSNAGLPRRAPPAARALRSRPAWPPRVHRRPPRAEGDSALGPQPPAPAVLKRQLS